MPTRSLMLLHIIIVSLMMAAAAPHPLPASASPTPPLRWIVRLYEPPLAQAVLHTPEFAMQSMVGGRLQAETPQAQHYRQTLLQQQQQVFQQIRAIAPDAHIHRHYTVVFNGMSILLPNDDAATIARIRALPGVAGLTQETIYFPSMYASIPLINAETLWNHPSIGGQNNAGEGIKIAVIDQGILINHPFFNPDGFAYPPGFPKGETEYTSPKVISARAYFRPDIPPLPGHETPQPGPNDSSHGLHVAGIAAGVANTSATVAGVTQTISGVAPRAYLMNYKVFYHNDSIFSGAFSTEMIAALEDAVLDGADVINNSWGGRADTAPAFDPVTIAAEAAADAGVTVVFAAGNAGPDRSTTGSPAYSEKFISVGAVTNAETIAAGFVDVVAPDGAPENLRGLSFVPAVFGPPLERRTILGPVTYTPVEQISSSPLACEPLPDGSLTNQIALIERGACIFALKVWHAQEAGAQAAIVYNSDEGGETLIVMAGGDESLDIRIPSIFMRRSNGVALAEWAMTHGAAAQLHIDTTPRLVSQTADVLPSFSARGPTFHHTLKPDVLAPGFNILSAGFSLDEGMERHSGFGVNSGTSMAAPHVAGAVALLKQVHPDWTSADMKSALMSTATTNVWMDEMQTMPAGVLDQGAGRIDLARAVAPPLIFDKPSLSFGLLTPMYDAPARAELTVTARNISGAHQSYTFNSRVISPTIFPITTVPETLHIGAGETASFIVHIEIPADAPLGDYEAMLELVGDETLHLPIWARALPPRQTATVLLLDNDGSSLPADDLPFPDVTPFYTAALDDLGISYTYLDLDALTGQPQTLPDIAQLHRYPLVIWFTGNNFISSGMAPVPTPLTRIDQNLLIAYLQSGGRLIATGQNLTDASDIERRPPDDPRYGRSDLYHAYLGSRFVQDNVFSATVALERDAVGTGAQPWLADIRLDLSDPTQHGIPAAIETSAANQIDIDEVSLHDADLRVPNEHTSPIIQALSDGKEKEGFIALNRTSSPSLEQSGQAIPFRSTYLAFGLEGVRNDTGTTSRTDLLRDVINWSLDESSVTVHGPMSIDQPGQSATFTAHAHSSTGAPFISYRWDVGDGSPIIETQEPTLSHTFAEPGNYTVRVEATNIWGHRTISDGATPPPTGELPPPPPLTRNDVLTTEPYTFPETGQTLHGRFLEFWQQHGGLAVFGYPISPTIEHDLMSQQFERARFEHHPDNPPPYDVLLGHLGHETLAVQGRNWHDFPTVTADEVPTDCRYFAETNHSLCGIFQEYWERHGLEFDGIAGSSDAESLALFGLPLSEPYYETGEDGTMLLMQWFERARFEHHPQNPPPYDVLLGRLGATN